jgi:hypothetical protein
MLKKTRIHLEVKNGMKRSMICFFSVLSLVLMVAPVMAVPDTAIPVTAYQPNFTGVALDLSIIHLNKGGIFFYTGVGTGTVDLTIGSETYTMKVTEQFDTTINTKTDQGESNRRILWEYMVDGKVIGAFEGEAKGVTHTTLYNPANGFPRGAFSTNVYHTVLQGSGNFGGQTLKLDGIRPTANPSGSVTAPANPTTWEGIVLTHGIDG